MGTTVITFSLDSSIGRLARWLRLLGHDAAWARGDNLPAALARARAEGRILLTRSKEVSRLGLAAPASGSLVIRSNELLEQLVEVALHWPIFREATPFSRCSVCNVVLSPADPDWARTRVPPYVARTQRKFQVCPCCERIFWGATHAEEILRLFREAARMADQPFGEEAEESKGARSETSDPAPSDG